MKTEETEQERQEFTVATSAVGLPIAQCTVLPLCHFITSGIKLIKLNCTAAMCTLDTPNLVPRKSQNRAIPVQLRLLLLLSMSKSGQVCQTQQIQDWSPCSGLGEPLFLEFLPYKKIGVKIIIIIIK